MKYIDADKIRAEIERLEEIYYPDAFESPFEQGVLEGLGMLKDFLNTLEPVSEDLEKKTFDDYLKASPAERRKMKMTETLGDDRLAKTKEQMELEEAAWDCVLDSVDVNNPVLLPKYKELLIYLFIAGAKRQKDKDTRDMCMSDNRHFQKVYELGKKDMKEQMMEGAVEGKVFMSFAPGHNQMVMADVDLPTNTKVSIIVLPKEEEQ